MSKWLKVTIIAVSSILALILALIGTVAILNHRGKFEFHKNDANITNSSVTTEEDGIVYKKSKYRLNPDVISFLLIGVDKGELKSDYSIGLNGQADTLLVGAVNTKTKSMSIIPISRETLVDVNHYSTSGEYVGVVNEQICLAYNYGKDIKQCSRNVLLSVSRALYGINISSYITMDLTALEKLSNSVGYIEVAVNEDYYDADSRTRYKAGQTIKVKGKSAVYYIHWRTDDVNANNFRMERQKNFITAFMNKAGNEISTDYSKIITYYNLMQPYVSTNISLSQTTYLATNCMRMNLGDAIEFESIPGETFIKDGYSAFTPDEDALTDIVIRTFYEKIPEKSQ
ncbi:MAG: LCP family protein [Clostridia bacterium]|nr:LCP family protein [Clostridia bacterium]